ncbi:MAG: helix-turn-helix domain-containing protein [Rhodospirillales bacterium]|nr:helix-turn-helix domain-containing protein [Rhodospirillales bacterium]
MPCAACDVRELSICSVLNGSELDRLSRIVARIPVGSGQSIFQEGDEADHVFNIVAGCVRLFKLLPDGRRQITGFLFDSDFLGLALKEHYAYSAEAVGEAVICRFPRGKLERLFDDMPKLEKRLLSEASNELIAAQDQMLLLGRKTALERLSSFLHALAERQGKDTVELPMTRTDIADHLGLTIETVSRTFTRLRKSGLIDTPDPHSVVIRDLAGLEGLTEGE